MIRIRDLSVSYATEDGKILALDGINLVIPDAQTFGIVGESGSGKSTLALALMRLLPRNGKAESGTMEVDGTDVLRLPEEEMARIRGLQISMVFQGAMNTLNPLIKIEDQVAEPLLIHHVKEPQEALEAAHECLNLAGLGRDVWRKYPHELSGGMKQRAVIATAIVSQPKVLIADEPTTALDVITQAQITNLLRDLQRRLNMTTILISHDLPLVAEVADRIAIFYAGKVCEDGTNAQVLKGQVHPYTRGLVGSVLLPGVRKEPSIIQGDPVDLRDPPRGCRFMPRCPEASDACASYDYTGFRVEEGHTVYCLRCGDHRADR
ncbi:MAG TPA: ABC transporter ATP-binding protein [Thermoplasmata archaeon]|nr:ABC transporter ATP-binding protein [Thermoplasmata archaeon]